MSHERDERRSFQALSQLMAHHPTRAAFLQSLTFGRKKQPEHALLISQLGELAADGLTSWMSDNGKTPEHFSCSSPTGLRPINALTDPLPCPIRRVSSQNPESCRLWKKTFASADRLDVKPAPLCHHADDTRSLFFTDFEVVLILGL
jgi:hypothetical protein